LVFFFYQLYVVYLSFQYTCNSTKMTSNSHYANYALLHFLRLTHKHFIEKLQFNKNQNKRNEMENTNEHQ